MDHSKMDMPPGNHSKMKMDNMPMGMAGHDHHKMMIADFRRRFYVVLVLTIPVLALSAMIQKFIGVHWQFPGSIYILLTISSFIFIYGGWPFLKGWWEDMKVWNPGMMTLIGFAISVSYIYSVATVFGLKVSCMSWI